MPFTYNAISGDLDMIGDKSSLSIGHTNRVNYSPCNIDLSSLVKKIANSYGDKFVFTIQTVGSNDTFTFPLVLGGTYNFTVNWGDNSALSTITAYNDAAITHTYAEEGLYEIRVDGTITGWRIANAGDRLLYRDIKNWGTLRLGATSGAQFRGCTNLTVSAKDELDLTGVSNFSSMFVSDASLGTIKFKNATPTNLMQMFYNCTSLVSLDLSGFNTSNVTNASLMFYGCENLEILNIAGWDTGNITTFESFVQLCTNLTTLDTNWNTAKVTTFRRSFEGCSVLTSIDTSSWDVSKVTSFYQTFYNCKLLTSIGDTSSWTPSLVQTYQSIFSNCELINGLSTSGWVTENTIMLNQMFSYCLALQNISTVGWDTSNVTNMDQTFYRCNSLVSLDVSSFDVGKVTGLFKTFTNLLLVPVIDLSAWNLSAGITTLQETFYHCESITELDLSGFDVSSVTSLFGTFLGCVSLNSLDLSGWGTSIVTDMRQMLEGCVSLSDLVIHHFDITSVTTMSSMFSNANNALSTSEYDAILIGWSGQTTPKTNVSVHFGDAKYSTGDATTARGVLTGTYGWVITDGGQV